MGFDPISFLMGKAAGGGGGGGGGDAWTLIGSKEFNVSTTSTSETDVGTINLDIDGISEGDIFVCHVRDKAGKRNGYFYGFEGAYVKVNAATMRICYGVFSYNDNKYKGVNALNGVYVSDISSSKTASVKAKYHATFSLTIDGTYKVDVYKLTPPYTMFE